MHLLCNLMLCLRKETNYRRNDLIDLMIDAMNDTLLLEDDKDEEEFELNTKTGYR